MSVEEWWGRTFEGRGSIAAGQRPDNRPETIHRLDTFALLQLVESEGDRSVAGLAAQMELRRRENWTARAALAISVLALIVAVVSCADR